MLRPFLALLAASALAVAVHAHHYSIGNLVIGHPWSRPTASGMPTGVAYLSITNHGPLEDTLLAAHTPAAARVEFHRTKFEAGMARMRPAGALVVGPNSTLTAEPGGLHLMLVELKSPLVAGSLVPLVLQFKAAGEITVHVKVEEQGSAPRH
ncbi:MAG TPA: copper chaperone PCu(A)C [Steroidobacteraceae bacterium]|nr:copper chaperone PCu(A)C [Steroidobacteraceae bacterium]